MKRCKLFKAQFHKPKTLVRSSLKHLAKISYKCNEMHSPSYFYSAQQNIGNVQKEDPVSTLFFEVNFKSGSEPKLRT